MVVEAHSRSAISLYIIKLTFIKVIKQQFTVVGLRIICDQSLISRSIADLDELAHCRLCSCDTSAPCLTSGCTWTDSNRTAIRHSLCSCQHLKGRAVTSLTSSMTIPCFAPSRWRARGRQVRTNVAAFVKRLKRDYTMPSMTWNEVQHKTYI